MSEVKLKFEFVAKLKTIADGTFGTYTPKVGANAGKEGVAFGSDKGTVFLSRKVKFPETDPERIKVMKKLNVYRILEQNTLVAAEGMTFKSLEGWE